MGTTTYFEKTVLDDGSDKFFEIDLGTTSFAGNGPQFYIRINGKGPIIGRENAQQFLDGVVDACSYLGIKPTNL